MKIFDISQEVLGCEVYPGDPAPQSQLLADMSKGDLYNLTAFSMCAHNGTHIDAPFHFFQEGKAVDEMLLETFVGPAYVVEHRGIVTADDAEMILEKAEQAHWEARERILIKGEAIVSLEAAEVFASEGILLLGNEAQTVGPEDAPMEVHQALLGAEIVLLEGVRLQNVPEGAYLLNAVPLNLSGADGAPCRAILLKLPCW